MPKDGNDITSEADGSRIGDGRSRFSRQGFIILPGIIPGELVERLAGETDHWIDSGLRERSIEVCLSPAAGDAPPPLMELEMPAHGELLSLPPLLEVISLLLGPVFAFHHMHSDRRPPDSPGKAWHHDYEESREGARTHIMVHALHYPRGLDTSMGSLAVLPGSHREAAAKSAREHLGTAELPGEVVIDRLPPGSTVLLHSALFHARRPPAVPGPRSRYMVDSSYCQGGVRWRPVKPYWRHMQRRAAELNLGRGRWPELFAEHHFTEYEADRPERAR